VHGSRGGQPAEGVEELDEPPLDEPVEPAPDEEPPDEPPDAPPDFAGAAGALEPVLADFDERESVR